MLTNLYIENIAVIEKSNINFSGGLNVLTGETGAGKSIVIDEGKHTVTVNDRLISLTLKEYELLKLLAENTGQVFTRDILLASVWGADFAGETRTVDVHIGTLRTKLDECGDMIKTVRGVGYKIEGQENE